MPENDRRDRDIRDIMQVREVLAMPDNAATRQRRHRGHAAGDHELCREDRCRAKAAIAESYREHMDLLAWFQVLNQMGIDAEWFFDQCDSYHGGYVEAVRKRDMEFPDWEDLDWPEPTDVDLIIARSQIKQQLPMEMQVELYRQWLAEHPELP